MLDFSAPPCSYRYGARLTAAVTGVLIAGTEVQLKLEIENVGSFMLFTKYKTATFALPWV
jgi:hypothetical protein